MRLTFTVPGEAVPQGSLKPFIVRTKDGRQRAIVTGDNARTKPWRALVAAAALDAQFLQGGWPVVSDRAIRLDITCFFVRPASVSERRRPLHTVKPDTSKLLRAIEDALTKILWRDDAQVVAVSIGKYYAPVTEPAHTVIRATEIVPVPLVVHRPTEQGSALPLLEEDSHV